MLKDIANGALITCLILAASVLVPIVGIFCSLLLPLPTLYYRVKLGRIHSALIPAISLVILMVAMNPSAFDMMFIAALLIIGFSLGELLESRFSIEITVLVTCGLVFLGSAVSLFLYSTLTGQSLSADFYRAVDLNREIMLHLYRSMGMPADSVPEFERFLNEIQRVVVKILPALMMTTTLLVTWINVLLGRVLLKGRQPDYPRYGRLNQWQAPDYLVWGVIGFGLLMLLPDDVPKTIGLNGLITLMMVYFFQGVAIISYFFERKQVPRYAKVMLYALLILQEVLLVVIVMGFIDVWANFRKLKTSTS
jgi:uncharacterized protein YybS (DUF2232 family)